MAALPARLPSVIRSGTELADAWNRLFQFGVTQVGDPYNQPFIVTDETLTDDVVSLGEAGVLTFANTTNGLSVQLVSENPGGIVVGSTDTPARPAYTPDSNASVQAVAKPTRFA